MATEWVANCSALVAERETAVLEEVAVALRREKTAYEARLGSLGWRLEEDARGLLYRSSR